jgi:hypothetical protein
MQRREAVEAFGGGENLAFGRMQGGGMMQGQPNRVESMESSLRH